MQYIRHYQCTECHETYDTSVPMNLCPADGRPVQLIVDTDRIAHDFADLSWYRPDISNMWRFGPLLPFDIGNQPDKVCSLGEGHTPLIDISHIQACNGIHAQVMLKDEGQGHKGFGCNPTGSFKDRGMAMVVTMAKHYGLNKLAVPTQGNAGDSLSEYAQRYACEVAVIMPDDTPMPIMGKVAAYSHLYDNVHLDLVKGTIREAGHKMKQAYLSQGYFNCATFQEPGWRIEGKKTMGLELAEPDVAGGPWRLPDVILYPTGGGTGILGMWKAFDELMALGVIDEHRPRIIAVQSEANAPVVDAFTAGDEDTTATDGGCTLATGLNVPGGVGHKAVLRILRQSNGGAIKVSESTIAATCTSVYQDTQLLISPEGAAAVAALHQAQVQGLIREHDNVVCFNTGSAEKYWPQVKHLFRLTDFDKGLLVFAN